MSAKCHTFICFLYFNRDISSSCGGCTSQVAILKRVKHVGGLKASGAMLTKLPPCSFIANFCKGMRRVLCSACPGDFDSQHAACPRAVGAERPHVPQLIREKRCQNSAILIAKDRSSTCRNANCEALPSCLVRSTDSVVRLRLHDNPVGASSDTALLVTTCQLKIAAECHQAITMPGDKRKEPDLADLDLVEVMPLGAGQEVGRSCVILKYMYDFSDQGSA